MLSNSICKNHDRSRCSTSPIRSEHTVTRNDKLKVFIRFKPNKGIFQEDITYLNDRELQIIGPICKRKYNFDHIFNQNYANHEIFAVSCKSLIDEVLKGTLNNSSHNNGMILVYGHTGTGKTYTMGLLSMLNTESSGIVPQSLEYLFGMQSKYDLKIWISFCEIYMDEVYDLLDFKEGENKKIIRQNAETKQPYVQNQIKIQVKTLQQAYQLINIGLERRKIAEQMLNRKSSRGHGLINIEIINNNSKKKKGVGNICLVDLAGSQRLKQTESKGSTLQEALHINTSLSALQTLLVNISNKNIRSYRSNKLTRILQPYIEYGSIKMFVTNNYENTQSIEFARRCKGIKFMQKEMKKKNIEGTSLKNNNKINKFNKSNEKQLMLCISHLSAIIDKIYENIQIIFSEQKINSCFSLNQVIKDIDIQMKINKKINNLQLEEQNIINSTIDNYGIKKCKDYMIKAIQNTNQFIEGVSSLGYKIIQSIKKMEQLSEYKNIYKKEMFTSQLKLSLVQGKNYKLEEAINFLLAEIGMSNKKVSNKLKNIGLVLASKQVNSPKQLTSSKQENKSINRSKTPRKRKSNHCENTPSTPVKRQFIYVDEHQ